MSYKIFSVSRIFGLGMCAMMVVQLQVILYLKKEEKDKHRYLVVKVCNGAGQSNF